MSRVYNYRNKPCTIRGSNGELWCVSGQDKITNAGGVLEWCYDQRDADGMLFLMNRSGEFSGLKVEKWGED